jgi:predicted DNA-binding WGR domain protein
MYGGGFIAIPAYLADIFGTHNSVVIAQPYQLYVERTDRTENMSSFYAMSIELTLFGDTCLTRRWGRIGARGQTLIHHVEGEEDAVRLFLNLTRQKRSRGYRALYHGNL